MDAEEAFAEHKEKGVMNPAPAAPTKPVTTYALPVVYEVEDNGGGVHRFMFTVH